MGAGCLYGPRLLARAHPCGSFLSLILVVHLCGSFLWLNFAVHPCSSFLRFILAAHLCSSFLSFIRVVHLCGSPLRFILVVLAEWAPPATPAHRSQLTAGSQCCPTRHAEGPCGCEQNTWTSTVLQEGEGTFSGLTWVCVTQTCPHPKSTAGPAAEPHPQGIGASAGSLAGARPPGPSPPVAPQPGPASPSLSPSSVTLTSPQGRISGSQTTGLWHR